MSAERFHFLKDVDTSEDYEFGDLEQVPERQANLVSSLCEDGKHRPLLDIDFGAKLVPSSTEGHYHLYLDKPLSFAQYQRLVHVLVEVGILEQGIGHQLDNYGMTLARKPGVQKASAS